MQIIQKYNYAELKRQDGDSRLYLTPDGESLPSVTTVLNKTKDKTFLKQWRHKVGEKKAEEIIKSAGQIGTALHLYICLLYTSPSPRDRQKSRMPSSA